MKKIFSIILCIVLMISISFICIICTKNDRLKIKLNKLNLKNVNNLMIVAHPDDESLWGGAHLSKSDYLVVCVTCGVDKDRQKEFNEAIKEFGNIGLSLGYPDKTNGQRDDWSNDYYKIENDLKKIINYKKWNMVVTHNPNGEYDHTHHKMISTMVTKNANKNKLYYFNKYYTQNEIKDLNYCIKEINDKELYAKQILLYDYPSQNEIINNHGQNIIYENFISYKYWN